MKASNSIVLNRMAVSLFQRRASLTSLAVTTSS
jgi:hypothetical protein